jgi:hypothetical protein
MERHHIYDTRRWGDLGRTPEVWRKVSMTKPLKLQIVERARALIGNERHWCRGELARDADGFSVGPTDCRAVRRCGLGALVTAAYQFTNDYHRAHDLAISAVRPLYGSATLVNVNDVRGHAAVLALLDDVIAAM